MAGEAMNMKSTLLLLLCVLAITGCSSLSRQQLSAYNVPEVPASVYAKIQRRQKLNLADIIEISKRRVRTSQIITYLAYSWTDVDLTQQDIDYMRREGVNGDIIAYLREKPDDVARAVSWL